METPEVVTRQLKDNEIKRLETGITRLQDIKLNIQQLMVEAEAPDLEGHIATKIMDKFKKCDEDVTTVLANSEAMLTRKLCEKKQDVRVSSRN